MIGYSSYENAVVWSKLFARPYFKVELVPDPVGAEMCGTLKNVVALAAGMVDGLGYGAYGETWCMYSWSPGCVWQCRE